MLSGNKNVDKSQQNTDTQEKKRENNEAIQEDPTVSGLCGRFDGAKNDSNNSGKKDETSEKNHPIEVVTVTLPNLKSGIHTKIDSEDGQGGNKPSQGLANNHDVFCLRNSFFNCGVNTLLQGTMACRKMSFNDE